MTDQFSWWRLIEVVIGVAGVFVPLWWMNRKEARKNHKENVEKFDFLINEQVERPAHKHTERDGNLTVDGLLYSPKRINNGVKT